MLHVGSSGLREGLTVSGNNSLFSTSGLESKLSLGSLGSVETHASDKKILNRQIRGYSFWFKGIFPMAYLHFSQQTIN